MLRGILKFSLILILSFLVNLAPVNAFEADAKFTVNAPVNIAVLLRTVKYGLVIDVIAPIHKYT
jgi:hypothetical protein